MRQVIVNRELETFTADCVAGGNVTFLWILDELFRPQWIDIRGRNLGSLVVKSVLHGVREQLAKPWELECQPQWLPSCPDGLMTGEQLRIEVQNIGSEPIAVSAQVLGVAVERTSEDA